MQVKRMTLSGDTLLLELDPGSRQEAGRAINRFKSGEYQLRKLRPKRSTGANAMAWGLIDKIAEATGLRKEEVYRNALQGIGGVSDIVEIHGERAFRQMKEVWEDRGLGWQCLREYSDRPGYITAVLIYGSSVFDSKQMSALINALQEDARELGIETLSERELSLLRDET